jgi:hypothetical protein
VEAGEDVAHQDLLGGGGFKVYLDVPNARGITFIKNRSIND